MTERQGIEIDYCPACRGVWLDRGELDKIIERSSDAAVPATGPAAPPLRQSGSHRGSQPYSSDRDSRHGHSHGKKPRKKKFLEQVFDIFD